LLEQVKAVLSGFLSPTAIIDLIIVALLLYWLVLLIKGTRAVQLIKGLAVLLIATAVSNWLHFTFVHWLLNQAITALLVALPVVFQPELRRALEKLGGGEILSAALPHLSEIDANHLLDEIVRAVYMLAQSNTGALLVLERTTGLEEYIDRGTRIEGIVSAELLMNIFTPGAPLHDGAVIIRGNRIAAAACLLPLTESLKIGKEMGTRHRAGVGVTEVSDALAIIVSEETGGISLAVEGILARDLDRVTLADRLKEAFKPRPGRRSLTFLWRKK
jgi:diadenylate cyclase